MPAKTQKYLVATPAERLTALRDSLRDAEMSHYRLYISSPADPTREERLANSQVRLDELQSEYEALMKEVEKVA